MPDLPFVIASAVAVLFASLTQGATGFGFVIVSVPIMAVYLDPKLAIPVLLLLGIALGLPLMVHTRREFNIGRVWPMMLAGAAFTPVGTLVLARLDAPEIKILLGAVTGTVSLALLLGFQRTARNQRLASIPVGAASGLLTGATGLAGAYPSSSFSRTRAWRRGSSARTSCTTCRRSQSRPCQAMQWPVC